MTLDVFMMSKFSELMCSCLMFLGWLIRLSCLMCVYDVWDGGWVCDVFTMFDLCVYNFWDCVSLGFLMCV